MSQGTTVKGKTAFGLNIEVRVDDNGVVFVKFPDGYTVPVSGIPEHVYGEVPSGAKNGVNKVFTTLYNYRPATIRIYLNGLRQYEANDYGETGLNQFTFTNAPTSSDILLVDYIKR